MGTLLGIAGSASSVVLAALWPVWTRGAVTAAGFVAGLVLVTVLLIIEWGAWALVRPGRRLGGLGPHEPPWEPIAATAADGAILHGARRAADAPTGRTALLLHGFGEGSAALLGRAEALLARGWDVVLPDARGRGRSEGEHMSFGGREAGDVRAWLDALTDRFGPGSATLLWGRSMGAAIALRAAVEDPRIAALILEAPYPDLRAAVGAWLRAVRIPRGLAGPILRRAGRLAGVPLDRPRPLDLAPSVRVPTLILHGTADPIIPPSEARRLADAFPRPATLIEVPGARHSDVFDVGGAELADRIAAFLDDAIGG
jgi:pimeloyl-ACP methyl ester carboxylesterase